MSRSLATLPLRISLRSARATLRTTRELADLGLAVIEFVGRALDAETEEVDAERVLRPEDPQPAPPRDRPVAADRLSRPQQRRPAPRSGPAPVAPPPPVQTPPDHVSEEAELVREDADPGAEEGAGAQLRVAPPFAGYDELRAPDVVARLRGVDGAELAETELYERTHRGRRTVLEGIAREQRRRAS